MGAQGSQSSVSFREEVVWGEKDAGQFTGANFTSEDMAFAIENKSSDNIRPDRQTADLIQVGAECSGGIETEFQAANLDGLLPGFFWHNEAIADTPWDAAPTGESVVFTTETGGGVGGIMTVTDSSKWSAGKVFSVVGSVSNDGTYTVKLIVDGTHVQVYDPLITETSVAVTFGGETIRNGVTKRSFSIERANNDISQFFLYLGMVPNTLEMSIESGSPVTAMMGFVGKDETLTQTHAGVGDPTALSTNPIINAVASVGEVAIDNLALASCLLQKVDFSLDNQVEGKTGVGVLGFCSAEGKSIALTGNISMYFQDQTYYAKYLDSTAFGLSFTLTDSLGNTYVLQIPQCKFDEATANVTGKDDDVMLEGKFVAIVSPLTGYSIQLTRFLV